LLYYIKRGAIASLKTIKKHNSEKTRCKNEQNNEISTKNRKFYKTPQLLQNTNKFKESAPHPELKLLYI
jgi:hypothetical protein